MSGRVSTRAFAVLLLFLGACAIQLAPAYDKQIVQGLESTSEAVMIQYAAVGEGSEKSKFSKMEPKYNELIGKLDALRMLSQSRYVPAYPTRGLFRRFNPDANVKASEQYQAPSIRAIEGMVRTLSELRDDHRDKGLKKLNVAASKNQFEIYLDQALTYERALER
jgi:hypothetical protein